MRCAMITTGYATINVTDEGYIIFRPEVMVGHKTVLLSIVEERW